MLRRGLATLLLSTFVASTAVMRGPEPVEAQHHCGCTAAVCCCHRPSGQADAKESKLSCCDGPSESAVPTSVALLPDRVADGPDSVPTSPPPPDPAAPAPGFGRVETPPPQPRRA
jgi:hypothetical protein